MTISERDWDLLQREVDGDTMTEESERLRKRRAQEPELDAGYQALLELERTLRQIGLVDPPDRLADEVKRQVRQRARAREATQRPLARLLCRLGQRPGLALASSLAAGLVVGVMLTSLVIQPRPGSIDEGFVAGTILLSGGRSALPVIEEASLEDSGLRATVVTRQGRGFVVAELTFESPQPVDVTVELDGQTLRLQGFETAGGLPTGEVVLEADRVRIRQVPGGRYLLTLAVLRRDPAPFQIRLESGGVVLTRELTATSPR